MTGFRTVRVAAQHFQPANKTRGMPRTLLLCCGAAACVASRGMYQDQGFFTDILVAGANFAMEEREHELAQYFNVNKSNKKTSPGLDRSHPKSDGCDALAVG